MDLNSLLLYTIENCKPISLQAYNSFLLLYETGIRHAELNRESIIYNDNDNFTVICKKNSELRYLNRFSLSFQCYDLLLNFTNKDILTSRTTLSNYFKIASYPYRIYKARNCISLHSFRYNYIQNLYNSNQSYEITQALVGHKDIKNTSMYIDSLLYISSIIDINDSFIPNPPPPPSTGETTWN